MVWVGLVDFAGLGKGGARPVYLASEFFIVSVSVLHIVVKVPEPILPFYWNVVVVDIFLAHLVKIFLMGLTLFRSLLILPKKSWQI